MLGRLRNLEIIRADAYISGPFLKEVGTERGASHSFPSLRAIILIWHGPPPSGPEAEAETELDLLVADISRAFGDRDGHMLDEFKPIFSVPLDDGEKDVVGRSVLGGSMTT